MITVIYYLIYPLLYAISLLPFPALYLLSDLIYIILFRLINYRSKVIHENLVNSFPEKSREEIAAIERSFKKYFCDLTLETIKTLSISKKEVRKRLELDNSEVFEKYFNSKQSIIIVMGHFGNWELGGARFGIENLHKLIVIYHPLKNKKFNDLIVHMRTRLGNELYSRAEVLRGMVRDRSRITATAFIADQTPTPENAYWTTFLNQDTPVFTGTEKIASKFNYPIVYASVFRTKRGYYRISAETLFENPASTKENEISERHTRKLEADILKSPEIWLWSHRRWKHKRKTQ